jgi:ribosomal-protein-alanine N-acetyltransferase
MSNTRQIVETPRLILREFSPRDAEALGAILSDPETMRFYPAPFNSSKVEEWITRNLWRYANDGHGLWAMVLKTNGEVIGDCGLTVQTVDGANEVEIGYHVRREHWRQGLATEAARACRDFGFAHFPVGRLISLIRPENLPSRRVAEKTGMTIWKDVIRGGIPHLVYSIRREPPREERHKLGST